MKQLLFVHGRSQEHKDSVALKCEWLDSLGAGLKKNNLDLPIPERDICFPYYGDTLFDLVQGLESGHAAEVIVRGGISIDPEEQSFSFAMLREIQAKAGITDEQIEELIGDGVVHRGPLNWEWVQGVLRVIDRVVPYGSSASIALFTHDVYEYLKNSNIRERIDAGIAAAITPHVETVVVSHSLGTVVAYNLIRREGHLRGWQIPFFVTLGSPLGVSAIRKTLTNFAPARCPECVLKWFNALDERDVVALYPLDTGSFPLDPSEPAIENKNNVHNRTTNRHGIAGYLDDPEVARRICEALSS